LKILVLVADYPTPDGFVSMHYVHSRNIWYVKNGIDVSVLSFGAKKDYNLDGVKVCTIKTYEKKLSKCKYDLLLSHAPNLRNHYKFLRKHNNRFNSIIFFFHGHEVLHCSKVYPKPYNYMKRSSLLTFLREFYDSFKLKVWNKYFRKTAYKSQFVFVSNWMYQMFIRFVKLAPDLIGERTHIIYNCIGESFEKISYEAEIEKKYDFLTIRNNLDGSKYAIDIVTRIAKNNPQYSFCVVGKGKFYEYKKKPNNLIWIDRNLTHEEIIGYLNQSKCALIPTRADAQGVMACEMATFGIPVITSDIDVCNEVFADFNNVAYIDNEQEEIDIKPIYEKVIASDSKQKNTKYFAENTIGKEIELFKSLKGK
jgi:glycosyltransferase involved in cell wall biosynthesis